MELTPHQGMERGHSQLPPYGRVYANHLMGMAAAPGSPLWFASKEWYVIHLMDGVFRDKAHVLVVWPRKGIRSVNDFCSEIVDDCFRGLGFTSIMYTFCLNCMRSSPPNCSVPGN